METLGHLFIYIIEATALYLAATVAFDIVHVFLHKMMRSEIPLLRRIGGLHESHHRYLDTNLRINNEFMVANLTRHFVPEFSTQFFFMLLFFFFLDPLPVALALGFHSFNGVKNLILKERNKNHQPRSFAGAPKKTPFVDPIYHAYHHVFPNKFYGSCLRIVDYVLGTALELQGKTIGMTGANGSFGSAMKALLEKEHTGPIKCFKYGVDFSYGNYTQLSHELKECDILILSHGAKQEDCQQANCDSFVAIIDLFIELKKNSRLAPEIWAVGSEAEFFPVLFNSKTPYAKSKRQFARFASVYYSRDDIIYRHIVPAAFSSNMGYGPISALTAAKIALFLIKRGFQYIPITYTAVAFINYFKILWMGRAQNMQQKPSGTMPKYIS
jgi:hypothetical protein